MNYHRNYELFYVKSFLTSSLLQFEIAVEQKTKKTQKQTYSQQLIRLQGIGLFLYTINLRLNDSDRIYDFRETFMRFNDSH